MADHSMGIEVVVVVAVVDPACGVSASPGGHGERRRDREHPQRH
jgi:hypothetical protein